MGITMILGVFLGSMLGFTLFLGLVSLVMAYSCHLERKHWEECVLQTAILPTHA